MGDASLNTHLRSFNSPIAVEEERSSLHDTLVIVLNFYDDRPEDRFKNGSFSPQNGPHHVLEDTPLNTHLQSFNGPIILEDERPSLEWKMNSRH